ncbi:MAG: hypothetical protein QOF51_2290, partial [Chloroflexota bacterium]|nr:hypothetical protein [Chloroflexota bacterium]
MPRSYVCVPAMSATGRRVGNPVPESVSGLPMRTSIGFTLTIGLTRFAVAVGDGDGVEVRDGMGVSVRGVSVRDGTGVQVRVGVADCVAVTITVGALDAVGTAVVVGVLVAVRAAVAWAGIGAATVTGVGVFVGTMIAGTLTTTWVVGTTNVVGTRVAVLVGVTVRETIGAVGIARTAVGESTTLARVIGSTPTTGTLVGTELVGGAGGSSVNRTSATVS